MASNTGTRIPLIGNVDSGLQRNASIVYSLLTLLHLLLGIACLGFPDQVGDAVFRFRPSKGSRSYEEQMSYLMRLGSTIFFSISAITWALKQAADQGSVASGEAQRGKGALAVFAPLAILLHLLYFRTLTWLGLLGGVAVFGATMVVPLALLGMIDSRLLGIGNVLQGVTSGLRTLGDAGASFRSLSSFLYALATCILFLAGLAYMLLPHYTLRLVFGHDEGTQADFLWRLLGLGLLTLIPSMTYVMKEATDNGFLSEALPTTMNAGLLLSSLVHLVVLGYLGHAREHWPWLLIALLCAWAAAFFTSLVGLFTAHTGSARQSPYEVL